MKKIKLIISLVVLISIQLVVFSGCSNISSYQKSIYEDDTKIVKQADSYFFKNRIGNTFNNKISLKYGTFNGIQTIWSLKAKNKSSITIEIDSDVNKGKFKCVLISPDNEIVDIFEGSKKETKTFDIEEGKSRIKLVGNDASGKLTLNIKSNDNVDIHKVD